MRSWAYESLLRRPTPQGSSSPRARDVQVPSRPPLRYQPLLGQALRQRLANRRESLAPRKGGGRPPKADEPTKKLLEEDIRKRPAATIADRRHFLESFAGRTLSEPTLRRLLKRMGFSRKKGLWGRWNATSS